MGSRVKRARRAIVDTPRQATASPTAAATVVVSIPEVTDAEMVFGNIGHLPPYDSIPSEFKERWHPCSKFISGWFFNGLDKKDFERLTEREGVDGQRALRAINSIMRSWSPKHEHKEAGCAYLLDKWFTLTQGDA